MDKVLRHLLASQLVLLLVSPALCAAANTLFFQPSNDLVVCPDNKQSCNTDTTCCLLPNGQYGCCMYANAVCCSDNIHCCPTGSYCDVNTGSCDKGGVKFEWSKKAPASPYFPNQKKAEGNVPSWIEEVAPPMETKFQHHDEQQPETVPWATKTPGLKLNSVNISSLHTPTSCSVSETLCSSGGLSGCCRFPNAVCCDNMQKCCPSGFKCNSKSLECEKPTEEPTKEVTPLVTGRTLFELRAPLVCPNNQTVCAKDATCCLVGPDSYACCPYDKATCCSDERHCCPNGYTCDVTGSQCVKKEVNLILVKMVEWKAGQTCPDQETTCPEGSTCCPLEGGSYGCCPYPQATCCTDHSHCCPSGYNCDLVESKCVRQSSSPSEILETSAAQSIQCPDKITRCPSSATCCLLDSGSYGCCPYVKATCCKDHVHCCPNGYACDVQASTCVKKMELSFTEITLPQESVSDLTATITCPDRSRCTGTSTCCAVRGKYQCCPHREAVCCHDNKHCCPKNYHCDLDHKRCVMGYTSLPLFKKFMPSAPLTALSAPQQPRKSVMCPDFSECPDRNTCCLMDTGAWGCCPYLEAVCCIDRKHCCPKTYFCDMKQSKCVSSKGRGSVNPIFTLISSKIKPAK